MTAIELKGRFEVRKVKADQGLVFGYGSIAVAKDGRQAEDLQDDRIDPDELEKAAYDFVLDSRETGEMHRGHAKGRLVESVILTPEKAEAMFGKLVDADALAKVEAASGGRWWLGFKIDDPAVFAKVKDGTYRMFSIQGRGDREPV